MRVLFLLCLGFLLLHCSPQDRLYHVPLHSHEAVNQSILTLQARVRDLDPALQLRFIDTLYAFGHGYGRACAGVEIRPDAIFLVLSDGTRIPFTDNNAGAPDPSLTAFPCLGDVLACSYEAFAPLAQVPPGCDPGRVRPYQLFDAVYGRTEKEIRANLVRVKFCGALVYFNKENGAAQALKSVNRELTQLLRRKPHYSSYLTDIEGTFLYRRIRNTDLLSPHAYGIAIDIRLPSPYYWLQHEAGDDALADHVAAVPGEIVRIFEKHHFIWGGRWHHFDKIHFEYRPEFFYRIQ